MDGLLIILLIATIIIFGIAVAYRLIYEKEKGKKNVRSYRLERLSALEQTYMLIGIIFLTVFLFLLYQNT